MSFPITPAAKARAAAALAALVIAVCGVAAFAASPKAAPRVDSQSDVSATRFPRLPSPNMYWGAWIGRQFDGTQAPFDMSAVSGFEQMVGKPLSLIEWASLFADCTDSPCSFYGFPTSAMSNVRDYGAIPFLSWGSGAVPDGPNQPDFQLSDVIAGDYDSYIRSFATAARNWGHPFFLRFNWEMTGNWFPWGETANGNQPGEYVNAWRHVHDIFTQVGATNATWVWCPYIDVSGWKKYRQLYPGDSYVDWTCLDGYNWGPGPAFSAPWRPFDTIFRSTYNRVVQMAPRKPMILGEMATSDYGGDQAGWIRNMFSRLIQVPSDYPKVQGVIYFDVDDRNAHWPIENSPAAISAFRKGIRSSAFAPNRFGQLEDRPIKPLAPRENDANADANE